MLHSDALIVQSFQRPPPDPTSIVALRTQAASSAANHLKVPEDYFQSGSRAAQFVRFSMGSKVSQLLTTRPLNLLA